jgi:hypothetical protein
LPTVCADHYLSRDFLDREKERLWPTRGVQVGMKSRALKRAIPNPVQEMEIINFHRLLGEYLNGDRG